MLMQQLIKSGNAEILSHALVAMYEFKKMVDAIIWDAGSVDMNSAGDACNTADIMILAIVAHCLDNLSYSSLLHI